jgi:hypothetical protein
MDIAIKGFGRKICNTERENSSIKMEIFSKDNLCMEANSEREFINSVMEKYTKDIFITDTVTGMEN